MGLKARRTNWSVPDCEASLTLDSSSIGAESAVCEWGSAGGRKAAPVTGLVFPVVAEGEPPESWPRRFEKRFLSRSNIRYLEEAILTLVVGFVDIF